MHWHGRLKVDNVYNLQTPPIHRYKSAGFKIETTSLSKRTGSKHEDDIGIAKWIQVKIKTLKRMLEITINPLWSTQLPMAVESTHNLTKQTSSLKHKQQHPVVDSTPLVQLNTIVLTIHKQYVILSSDRWMLNGRWWKIRVRSILESRTIIVVNNEITTFNAEACRSDYLSTARSNISIPPSMILMAWKVTWGP